MTTDPDPGINRASVAVDTITDLIGSLEACRTLGIKDITVTSVARDATPGVRLAGWVYHLDAAASDPVQALAALRPVAS